MQQQPCALFVKNMLNPKHVVLIIVGGDIEGMKQEKAGEPPIKCSNDWQYVDNSYHYFDHETSGVVTWKQLIIEAVEKEPSI